MPDYTGNTKTDLFNLEQDYLLLKNYLFKYAKPYDNYINPSAVAQAVDLGLLNNERQKLDELYQQLRKAIEDKSSQKSKLFDQYNQFREEIMGGVLLNSPSQEAFAGIVKAASTGEEILTVNKMKATVQAGALHQHYLTAYQRLNDEQKMLMAAYILKQTINPDSMLERSDKLAKDVKDYSLSREEILKQLVGDKDAMKKAVLDVIDLEGELAAAKEKFGSLEQKRKMLSVEIEAIESELNKAVKAGDSVVANQLTEKLKPLKKQDGTIGKELRDASQKQVVIEKLLSKKKDSVPMTEIMQLLSDSQFSKLVTDLHARNIFSLTSELNAKPSVDAANQAFNVVINSLYSMSNLLRRFSSNEMTYKSAETIQNELCQQLRDDARVMQTENKAFDQDFKMRFLVALSNMNAKSTCSTAENNLLASMARFKSVIEKDPQLGSLFVEVMQKNQTQAQLNDVAKERATKDRSESFGAKLYRRVSRAALPKLINKEEPAKDDQKVDTPKVGK